MKLICASIGPYADVHGVPKSRKIAVKLEGGQYVACFSTKKRLFPGYWKKKQTAARKIIWEHVKGNNFPK